MMKPIVIGIAGGSASGKTSVARKIKEAFDDTNSVTIIRQDDYYKNQSHFLFQEPNCSFASEQIGRSKA
ncbi:MAG: zeta toxin family protein, partial [Anaerorhabdus sp.]